jgi:hypothetical protein
MALSKQTARKCYGGRLPPRVLFPPMAPPPEVVVISDDEEEAPMLEEEELMLMEDPMIVELMLMEAPLVSPLSALPAPTPAPAPASLPVPAPSPIAPSVEGVQEMVPAEEEPGWTRTYIYKHAPATAYHHNLLRNMLLDYYPNHSHIKRVHHLRPSTRVHRPRPGFTGSFST